MTCIGTISHQWCNYKCVHLVCCRSWIGNHNQVKPNTMQLAFAASSLSPHHDGEKAMTSWPGIRIMCPTGALCIPTDLSVS